MLKRVTILALFALMQTLNISARKHEVIYTNDGKSYKGEVVEFLPNKTITINQCEGGLVTLDYSSVVKYAKEPEDIFLKKGYRGFFFLETSAGKDAYVSFSMSTVHGLQLSPNFFIGAGAQYRTGSNSDIHLPLFLDAHYDVRKTAKSPYFDVRFGPDILLTSSGEDIEGKYMYDYYASLSFGYRIKHFVVDFGVETVHYVESSHYASFCVDEETGLPVDIYGCDFERRKSLNFFLKFGLSF